MVVHIGAAGDQDLFVAGKFDGSLAAARKRAAVGNRFFIERGEIGCRGNGVRVIKSGYIGAEHEDFSVGEQRGTGGMEIEAALGRDRASARIEFVDGVSCVALE